MSSIAGTKPGDVIAGKFQVERVLGTGGMGVVLAATHLQLGERVAIKVLLPELAIDRATAARFMHEARAAFRIRNEHVARVTDVGALESGTPYLVMEYLKGHTIEDALAKGPLPVEKACEYVLQACEALAAAHALGFVHRDIKPSNLFITRRDDGSLLLKVLDFGISKALDSGANAAITKSDDPVGTPAYMSPEQMLTPRDIDTRTDVWSLGVVLHELISGALPFAGESVSALWVSITRSDPTPLRASAPHAPARLEEIILRCLRRNREGRFATIAELAASLAPFAPKRGVEHARRAERILRSSGNDDSSPPPDSEQGLAHEDTEPAATPSSAPSFTTQRAWDTYPAGSRQRHRAVVIGGLLVAAAAVPIAWSMARRTPAARDEANAATSAATTSVPASAAPPSSSVAAAVSSSASPLREPAATTAAQRSSAPRRPAPVPPRPDPFRDRTW